MKKGFKVPSPCVSMADMTRVIRSEEIQDIVRPPKREVKVKMNRCKPNPLKNEAALAILNPYAAEMKSKAREAAVRMTVVFIFVHLLFCVLGSSWRERTRSQEG